MVLALMFLSSSFIHLSGSSFSGTGSKDGCSCIESTVSSEMRLLSCSTKKHIQYQWPSKVTHGHCRVSAIANALAASCSYYGIHAAPQAVCAASELPHRRLFLGCVSELVPFVFLLDLAISRTRIGERLVALEDRGGKRHFISRKSGEKSGTCAWRGGGRCRTQTRVGEGPGWLETKAGHVLLEVVLYVLAAMPAP